MKMLKLSSTMVPLVMVVCGLWVFVSKCEYLLNTLLSLEFIMLGMFFCFNKMEVYFLSMVDCEGALGLYWFLLFVLTVMIIMMGLEFYDVKSTFSTIDCNKFYGVMSVYSSSYFLLCFLLVGLIGHDFYLCSVGYNLGVDYLSYALILLSSWIMPLTLCASEKMKKNYFSLGFLCKYLFDGVGNDVFFYELFVVLN